LALTLDALGVYDPAELYSALVVDAPGREVADAVMAAAKLDGRVTHGQWRDLKSVWEVNHGEK
jgi:hypothetical protein